MKIATKQGVVLDGLSKEMEHANKVALQVWGVFDAKFVITSGLDGEHMEGSKHYTGNACDYRTWYFHDEDTTRRAAEVLQLCLGDDYDVVIEPTHIHCEYDPK